MNHSGKSLCLLWLLACSPLACIGHGGRTDSNSGHYNRTTGEYHCHQEPCFSNLAKTRDAYDEAVQTGRPFSNVYRREDWPHWIDTDHDCQDTRAEVLILYSTVPVTFTPPGHCRVAHGQWLDPYTGNTYVDPADLDIDHVVSLAHAHRSGGANWSREQKMAFANDVANLLPVDDSTNQSKSDKTPDQWKPPRQAFWCRYATIWQFVKQKYHLNISAREGAGLKTMFDTCH